LLSPLFPYTTLFRSEQLRQGMSKEQVSYVLGNPMNLDSFNHDRWGYVYYFKPGRGKTEEKKLVLDFNNDALSSIGGDYQAPASLDRKSTRLNSSHVS